MDFSVLPTSSSVTAAFVGWCFGYFLGYIYNYKSVNQLWSIFNTNKSVKDNCNDNNKGLTTKLANNVKPTHVVALIINSSLKMGKGKVAAQCGHAILSLYKKAKKQTKKCFEKWIEEGQEILLVSVQSAEDFEDLAKITVIEYIPYYIVADAGRTQIKSGSLTVMAMGPSHRDIIDNVVGRLPLYL